MHKKNHQSLPEKTPVLAVRATHAGICILGQDARQSQFIRYDESLEARLEAQKRPRRVRFQAHGKMTPPVVESLEMNPIQRSMFRRLMYGLKSYSVEEIAGMSAASQSRVERDHKRCTDTVHQLKVNAYFRAENSLLNACLQAAAARPRQTNYRIVRVLDRGRYRNAVELLPEPEPNREPVQLGEKPADYHVHLPGWATLRTLGISTRQVVSALIGRGLLPENFFSLTSNALDLR